MDMIFQGCSMSLFQASQLRVTMNHITNLLGIPRVSLNHSSLVLEVSKRMARDTVCIQESQTLSINTEVFAQQLQAWEQLSAG
jgi:hypothetical protein